MADPTLEIQAAVMDRLRTSPDLLALFGGELNAYDSHPPGLDPDSSGEEGFPFIRVGDYDVGQVEALRYGEIVDDPSDVTLSVHVFARGAERFVVAKQISAAISRALATELVLEEGFKNTLGEATGVRHFEEPDRLTAHSVLSFRYYVESSQEL